MRVVILGKGKMLSNLIIGAINANVDIVGILRYENLYYTKPMLRIMDSFKHSEEITLIKKFKFNDLKFNSANSQEFKNEVLKLNADIILVGTWAEKLDNEIINLPKIAAINVHPSLLPKYRGPNPYLQTIWNREKYSGITFHLMTDKFDAGPILAQNKIEIQNFDTGKELKDKTVYQARILCTKLLNELSNNPIIPIPQDEKSATYFPDIDPKSMTLDFCKETAEEICAHVRAFYPFRPTYIQDGQKFYIVNPYKIRIVNNYGIPSQIIKKSKNTLVIGCKDNISIEFSDLKRYKKFFI